MEEEEKGFKVRDRRSLSQEEDKPAVPPTQDNASAQDHRNEETTAPPEETPTDGGAFPVNFSSFVLSLATSALIHLGEESNPATGQKSIQLPMARQVIDLISILEEKTKGNLTPQEASLLSELLYTLRMKYVETEKKRHP